MTRHLEGLGISYDDVMAVPLREAIAVQVQCRVARGFMARKAPMLGEPADNAKTSKGSGTYTLTLSPADDSEMWNTCTWSTPGCRAACVLQTAGKGPMASVRNGRRWKTDMLGEYPLHFLRLLVNELDKLPAGTLVRLNTASDIRWELVCPWLFEMFAELKFYDYTKAWGIGVSKRGPLPDNYRVTYSATGERHSWDDVHAMAERHPVAVVINVKRGHPVPVGMVDGDKDDNRFDDQPGIIALRAKGAAINNPGEFVMAV